MKSLTNMLNILGFITFFWAMYCPDNVFALATAILLPIVSIIIAKISGRSVDIFYEKGGKLTVFFSIVLPAIAVGFIGFNEFFMYDGEKALLYGLVLCVVLLIIVLAGITELNFKKIKSYLLIMILLVFMFFYSHGTIVILNCYHDQSTPQIFRTSLIDKDTRTARLKNYYFKMAPWHTQVKPHEIKVTQQLYDKHSVNDTIGIQLRTGRLGIEWFNLGE